MKPKLHLRRKILRLERLCFKPYINIPKLQSPKLSRSIATMEKRRLSAAEKGKSIHAETYQAPRTARVRIQEPINEDLLQRHSLTIIGRVTNPSAQKIWSVINFFSEQWKSETKPVGADLGQGLFQFQFNHEEDLLSVLEKRPYHYAKWMVIVQRWEPTTSPAFPSLIPFWIKVQGIPVHL